MEDEHVYQHSKSSTVTGRQPSSTLTMKKQMQSFFPVRPEQDLILPNYEYPTSLNCSPNITKERIRACVKQLSPYKASRPDGIPNIMLQKSLMYLADYLIHIYQAIIKLNKYPMAW
jgi:hypothetical protein